jgi:hypothetical protein
MLDDEAVAFHSLSLRPLRLCGEKLALYLFTMSLTITETLSFFAFLEASIGRGFCAFAVSSEVFQRSHIWDTKGTVI